MTYPDERTRLEERDRRDTAHGRAMAKWDRFNEPRLDEGEVVVGTPVQLFRRRARDCFPAERILMYQAANYMEKLERENEALKARIREMETR